MSLAAEPWPWSRSLSASCYAPGPFVVIFLSLRNTLWKFVNTISNSLISSLIHHRVLLHLGEVVHGCQQRERYLECLCRAFFIPVAIDERPRDVACFVEAAIASKFIRTWARRLTEPLDVDGIELRWGRSTLKSIDMIYIRVWSRARDRRCSLSSLGHHTQMHVAPRYCG